MKVEMVKLNKVKIATSEEQKKLLADQGYKVLLEVKEDQKDSVKKPGARKSGAQKADEENADDPKKKDEEAGVIDGAGDAGKN